MRTLVVYGTKSGCTTAIAEKIGQTLAAQGHAADVRVPEAAGAASDYDAVIVGSGVRAGSWHKPVREWVAQNAETLKAKPVAFFTCCLTITDASKDDEVRAYTDALISETGVRPIDVGLFAGWNEPSKFGLLERTIMKAMKAPVGDFRELDSVAAWAEKIAPQLGSG